jgi:hypothetical protein
MRVLGALTIVTGVVVLGLDVTRFDSVVETLSPNHGLHLSDVLGSALVGIGILLMWFAPPR